ncbi:MAG: LysR family transcriptional regulator [Oscillospiraceae bacterium]|nr:LysR family transcriptional regulator [Oscillospiraceae bacterium]
MTESQISCFEAVAKFRSFSKAASSLMISQPAISHQIAKLEQELDLLLFDRTGREIRLTEAGMMMLEFFSQSKERFASVLNAAHAQQNVYSGQVLLGCPEGWDISPFLPSMVNSFQEKYPNVHVELVGLPLGEIEDALHAGKINVAVTMRYAIKQEGLLYIHPLISVSSVLLYSKQFLPASDRVETLADFKNCTFYLAAGNSTPVFRQSVTQECAKYGFVPQMVNCPSLSTALFYVQNNQGVLLGNELMIAKQLDYLYSYLVLNDTQRPVVLAWTPVDADTSPVHLFLNETLYNGSSRPYVER